MFSFFSGFGVGGAVFEEFGKLVSRASMENAIEVLTGRSRRPTDEQLRTGVLNKIS